MPVINGVDADYLPYWEQEILVREEEAKLRGRPKLVLQFDQPWESEAKEDDRP